MLGPTVKSLKGSKEICLGRKLSCKDIARRIQREIRHDNSLTNAS